MVGSVLKGYELIEQIGCGGSGEVFLARHRLLGHAVAVKLLAPGSSVDRLGVRFLREARALAAIQHPGIVRIIDMGHSTDGRPFIIMELLDGVRLSAAIGQLSVAEVIAIARQLASALTACHEAHIVHRDLKPQNVMLVDDPDLPLGRRAKLFDFGMAKSLREDEVSITRVGFVVGTPHYMPPERCITGTADARSDIYCLGLVVYELLAGRHAFAGRSLTELLKCHVHAPPPRIDSLRPDIQPELATVIMRCLAKDPGERFQTAAALSQALEGIGTRPRPSAQLAPPREAHGRRALAQLGGRIVDAWLESLARFRHRPPSPRLNGALMAALCLFVVVGVAWIAPGRTAEPTNPASSSIYSPPVEPPQTRSAAGQLFIRALRSSLAQVDWAQSELDFDPVDVRLAPSRVRRRQPRRHRRRALLQRSTSEPRRSTEASRRMPLLF